METEPVLYNAKQVDSNTIEIDLNGQKIYYIVNSLNEQNNMVNSLNEHNNIVEPLNEHIIIVNPLNDNNNIVNSLNEHHNVVNSLNDNNNIVNSLNEHHNIVNPLNDHDYTYKNDSLLPLYRIPSKKQISKAHKKQNKTPKITSIKAIHNCKICGYRTISSEIMTKHRKLHESITPGTQYIPCGSCTIQKITKTYQKCPDCSFTSKSLNSLKLHMRIHSNGTPYKCTECDFSGKDLKQLIKHYDEVKNLTCDECTYVTHVPDRLLRHQKKHYGAIDM